MAWFRTSSPFSNKLSVRAQSARPTPSLPSAASTGSRRVLYNRVSRLLQGEKSLPPFIRLGRVLVTEKAGREISRFFSRVNSLGKSSVSLSTSRWGRPMSSQARRLRASRASAPAALALYSSSAAYHRSDPA